MRQFAAAVVLLTTSGIALGETVTVVPTRDNTLYQSTSGDVSNGAGVSIFAGVTNQVLKSRAVVYFDLSSIPAGSTITDAQLRVFCTRTQSSGANVFVHRVLASWGEGTSIAGGGGGAGGPSTAGDATWIHRFYQTQNWSTPGGDFSPVISTSKFVSAQNQAYTFPSQPQFVADVQGWVDAPASNFGLLLKTNELASGDVFRFASREDSADQGPRLTITYTPPTGGGCNDLDFNNDDVFPDTGDIADFLSVFSGGACSNDPNCDSIDFNNDGVFPDTSDIEAFLRVFSGGDC
jgi:hypothetical protein